MLKKFVLSTASIASAMLVVLIIISILPFYSSLFTTIVAGICSLWILVALVVKHVEKKRNLEPFYSVLEESIGDGRIAVISTPLPKGEYSRLADELIPKPLNSKKHDR